MQRRLFNFRRTGFTLIEILVVIVVILLMIGMAMPVFRVITSSRSEEGAANNVSAMLGRARADALGLQKPIGVAIMFNPGTQLTSMGEVEFPEITVYNSTTTYVAGQCVTVSQNGFTYYFVATAAVGLGQAPAPAQSDSPPWQAVYGPPLELRADTDLVLLPAGVAAQTVCNTTFTNGARTSDGYLSVGVILFDGKGRLASLPYGIALSSKLVAAAGLSQAYPSVPGVIAYSTNTVNGNNPIPQYGVMSQFGLVLFQRDAFVGQGFANNINDPTYNTPSNQVSQAYTAGTPSQQTQETWLDENSTPLLIDRFTGELIRAE